MPQGKILLNGHVYTEGALCANWAIDFGAHHCFPAQIHTQKIIGGQIFFFFFSKKSCFLCYRLFSLYFYDVFH